jgi:cell shape-determining protein MreD
MLKTLHLNSFQIYNILLILVFSIITNTFNSFSPIYLLFYCIFHFMLIYLGIYYYRQSLYLIFFIYGLLLDIYLLNEIGPHLLVFILMLLFVKKSSKFMYNLTSLKIYICILILQIIIFFLEYFISYVLFNSIFNMYFYFNQILISMALSFPIFLLFSKIDQLK